jgi:hypothetical protein
MPPPRWTARGKPSVHSKASAREVQRFFSLFPKDEVEDEVVEATPPPLPRSTAPPRLQREDAQEQGRGNRKRVPTIGYEEAREQDLIGSLGHSSTQHHA